MEFLATTVPGFEEIALDEVEEITGSRGEKEHRGMVRMSGKEQDIFKLNYLSKTLHRVLLLLDEFRFTNLEDIYQKICRINFSKFISSDQKFAARIQRHGEHGFTSMNVESKVGQAIVDSFKRDTGSELDVDLDNPNVIFRGEVRHDTFWISVDTTGQNSLHKRGYRVTEHPAPLKPTIAHCLIRLSGWSQNETIIDPMCGSGTICIEAGLFGNNIPNFFRNDYDFNNFKFLDSEKLSEVKKDISKSTENENLYIFGNDVSEKHVKNARNNAERADIDVTFTNRDATEISLDYDRIVTNIPYGIRLGNKQKIRELYEKFTSNLLSYDWKKAVIITGSPELLPKKHLQKISKIKYGNLPVKALIYEK